MRKTSIILFIISLFQQFAVCQWVQQVSPVTTSLLDIDFIDQNTGWACGDNGVICKTTNGGVNWFIQPTGVTKRLEGIDAVDANILYCVGWFQTILKSTNSGNNWIIIRDGQVSPPDPTFFKCYFLNANTGWLLRSLGGYVLRTTNSCATFDSTFTNHSFNRDVYFKNSMTGVLCGDGAWIMRSTDGGVTWTQISLPLFMDAPDLYRLSFIGDTGWTIGRGDNSGLGKLVFRTTNFGISWDSIARIQYPNGEQNYSVFFATVNTGYAGGTTGIIYKSTNGGFNWLRQNSPSNGFRNDFWFANDSLGWCVGGGGHIYRTTNGGTYVGLEPISSITPSFFKLYQNYPNPFNNQTIITFDADEKDFYKLEIFDITGRKIDEIFNGYLNNGSYKINYSSFKISSGVYFYRLSSSKRSHFKKFILIK